MSYQPTKLEKSIIDLARVGISGNTVGVRQLAQRILRLPLDELSDADAFREALAETVAHGVIPNNPLRQREWNADDNDFADVLRISEPIHPYLPVLGATAASAIEDVIAQRRRIQELLDRRIPVTRSVLLTGPPGVGKTMTAHAIASALGLPIASIDLASLMSSLLGATGRRVSAALRMAADGQRVVFLDEFDALAKRRDDVSDVGELKRLVNILLLELDAWPEHTLLIAATNHPQLLDEAALRRFDLAIQLDPPDQEDRRLILERFLVHNQPPDELVRLLSWATEGWTGSDLEQLARRVERRAFLGDIGVDTALLAELNNPVFSDRSRRDALCAYASDELGMSHRTIARYLGISHPTVAAALQRSRARHA